MGGGGATGDGSLSLSLSLSLQTAPQVQAKGAAKEMCKVGACFTQCALCSYDVSLALQDSRG